MKVHWISWLKDFLNYTITVEINTVDEQQHIVQQLSGLIPQYTLKLL